MALQLGRCDSVALQRNPFEPLENLLLRRRARDHGTVAKATSRMPMATGDGEQGKSLCGGLFSGGLLSGICDVRLDLRYGNIGHHETWHLFPVHYELALVCDAAEVGAAVAFVIVVRPVLGGKVVTTSLSRAELSPKKTSGAGQSRARGVGLHR